ncbi:MAG TPA: glycogen/starch synthase, partial [Rubricoccaceae bacterium]
AECAPFAKVGGLGDVVGALPLALADEGVEASVVMPLYGGPGGAVAHRAAPLTLVGAATARLGEDAFPARIWRSDALGVPVFFVDEPVHFGDAGVYFRTADGLPFSHADARFVVFQLAVLDWLGAGAPAVDALHLHDNHTALIPALQRAGRAAADVCALPTVFTVHSADHQGEVSADLWDRLGLPTHDAWRREHGQINAMQAAIDLAGAVTTVSPGYARELASDDTVAHGLAAAFRHAGDRFSGVLNGIDAAVWNPATDPHLPHTYTAADLAGKAATKAAVCAELNLDATRPLVAFVGRLMPEKGVEVLLPGLDTLVRTTEASVALLGTGDPEHEAAVRGLSGMLAADGLGGRLAAVVAFDERLAHRLYAAADVFAMPSRSEPCGLGQMYAMAYGTPPVVHATGGLRDTVRAWDGTAGTGFCFDAFTPDAFIAALREALAVYDDAPAWARLQRAAMAADFSWSASARTYAARYRALTAR